MECANPGGVLMRVQLLKIKPVVVLRITTNHRAAGSFWGHFTGTLVLVPLNDGRNMRL